MKRMTPDHIEQLQQLSASTGRGGALCNDLEARGFAHTGQGRFGTWARITEAGRQYLSRMESRGGRATPTRVPGDTGNSHSPPEATAGAVQARAELLRDAATRTRRNAAKDARSRAAIQPPAAAQDVGAPISTTQRGKPRSSRNGRVADVLKNAPGGSPYTATRKRHGA